MMSEARSLCVRLSIPADRMLAYYRNDAEQVLATAIDGRTVQFPAATLRPFVTHAGVNGLFEIAFDENSRLIAMRRVGD